MAKAAYPTIGIAAFVILVVYFIGCLRGNHISPSLTPTSEGRGR